MIAERLALPEIVGRLLAQRGIDSTKRRVFSRRGCATSCPTRRICATWMPPRPGSSAPCARARRSPSSATTMSTARPRRRCWRGFSRRSGAAPGSTCRTACARAMARTRRRCCACKRKGRASSSPSIAARLRICRSPMPLQAGLEVIVVDHHVAEPLLPTRGGDRQPEPARRGRARMAALAAVGVAFLLVVAVNRALRQAGWYVGAASGARPAGLARSGGARHGLRCRPACRD